MKKIAIRGGLAAAVTFLVVAPGLVGSGRDVAAQDGSPYTLRGFNIAADGDSATAAPPGCTFIGIWRGDYFSSHGVSFWQDHHADGSDLADWVADFSGAAPGEEIEIVLVQRVDETTDRINLGHGASNHGLIAHIYPAAEDLEVGFDVYLCRRPNAAPPRPVVFVTATDPLTIQVIQQRGTTWTGNVIFVSPPGISEIAPQSGAASQDVPITGPIILQTGVTVPIVPVVSPQFFGGPVPSGHAFQPLAVTPVPNDRTGFVWSVTPNETLWRPVFRMAVAGAAGPFDFPGPRIFNAFDTQIITLNLPNSLVPAGTGTDDVQLSIPSSGALNQAPPESHLFQRGASVEFDGGAGNDVLSIQTTLYNPLGTGVTLTNDSIGVALTNCETGVPYFTGRSTLNAAIPGGSNSLVSFNLDDRINIGPELPELPDPDSPTFADDMFAWFDEVCVVMESHPALTLP